MSDKTVRNILALVVFLVALLTYLLTMAASVSVWDSGEFIATSYILGIPHSPGTPLYVLVGRVFTMLPLPFDIPQKVNFLSVFFGALGVAMAYLVMVAVVRFMFGPPKGRLERFAQFAGPMVGSFYVTFSHTYWWDSTEAEVYALSAFVMGFCTLLALRWYRNPAGEIDEETREAMEKRAGGGKIDKLLGEEKRDAESRSRNLVFLIIYLLSLGIGFHLGTILVYGGVFMLFVMVKKKAFSNMELFIFTFGLAVVVADMTLHKSSQATVIGLVIFAILVIWSTISEGKFALVATILFVLGVSVHLFLYIRSGLNPAIDEVDPETWKSLYAHLRREQYPPINIFKRKAPMLFQLSHFGRYFAEQFRMLGDVMLGRINLGILTVAIPTALGLYGIVSNYTREKKTWVLNFVILLLNSVGLLVFLNFSDSEVRERDYFYGGAFYYFSIFIGIGAAAILAQMAEYAKLNKKKLSHIIVLTGVIMIALSIMPARYNWYTHDRSRNYIAHDYAYNMLAGLEPDAIIFTNGDNDTFPLWYIQNVEDFRKDVRVANRSLLNTPWYIKQIRDEKPTAPVSMTDEEISRMRPIVLKGGKVAQIHDLSIQHIIQENRWKQPIYFAVTVPLEIWEPYSEYLEMEGMVRRLVPYKGKDMMNEFMIARNFDDIYKFRGVLTEDGEIDDSVHKTWDMSVLFVNFAIAATQLGQLRAFDNDYVEAIPYLELAMKLDPSFKWARMWLGTYYVRAEQPQKAIGHYQRMIEEDPEEGEYWLRLSRVYQFEKQNEAALRVVFDGIKAVPNYRHLFIEGFRIAATMGEAEVAKEFVRRWLVTHPDDQQFRSLNRNVDKVLEDEFGIVPPGRDTSLEGEN